MSICDRAIRKIRQKKHGGQQIQSLINQYDHANQKITNDVVMLTATADSSLN